MPESTHRLANIMTTCAVLGGRGVEILENTADVKWLAIVGAEIILNFAETGATSQRNTDLAIVWRFRSTLTGNAWHRLVTHCVVISV
jgi:hypothetical protein